MKRTKLLTACLAALSLAACGQSAPKVAAGPSAVGVFTSGPDCAASGKLQLDDCNALLQRAIQSHQQSATKYISLRLCEEAEGVDRCERADTNAFRRGLLAFQVTFSTPPVAIPLYAPADKAVIGFTTLDKSKTLLAVDEMLIFSQDAKTVALGSIN